MAERADAATARRATRKQGRTTNDKSQVMKVVGSTIGCSRGPARLRALRRFAFCARTSAPLSLSLTQSFRACASALTHIDLRSETAARIRAMVHVYSLRRDPLLAHSGE